jgi:ribosome-binding factor A
VVVTAVVLSVDYRHARVHFAIRGVPAAAVDRVATERALARVTPFLRARLADALDLKRVPDLRFVFDGVARIEDHGER